MRQIAEFTASIEPQIEASLDAQEEFAQRVMRRWMELAGKPLQLQ
ncbi:MAG: hypothetical protein U0942_04790 [Parvibaculum sp.]|nr:hypothetical protein [Parvibaculum sp.]MDZ4380638.1 hypothetical protein [Parvibaculum sp.]